MAPKSSPFKPNPSVVAKIKLLSDINIDKIYLTILDILYALEMASSNAVSIKATFGHLSEQLSGWNALNPAVHQEYRTEAINKLEEWGIIRPPEHLTAIEAIANFNNLNSFEQIFRMVVNIEQLQSLRSLLESIRSERKLALPVGPLFPSEELADDEPQTEADTTPPQRDPEPQVDSSSTVYEVRYTPAQEVILNNFNLATPDFNSENDNVLNFLIKNPNRTISREELTKALGGESPKKSLQKVVENLGFRGELQKVFFSISKTGILFRNPVTQTMLEELGIKRLKLPLK